jgi:hypothetical protein
VLLVSESEPDGKLLNGLKSVEVEETSFLRVTGNCPIADDSDCNPFLLAKLENKPEIGELLLGVDEEASWGILKTGLLVLLACIGVCCCGLCLCCCFYYAGRKAMGRKI